MITTETLEYLIRIYGYWALLVGTFLEGETILMIGGLTAQLGYLDLPLVMVIAFIGSFSGDQAYFYIGRFKGKDLLSKHPKWHSRVDKVHKLLHRYHDLIMLTFRFVYGIRIMTPIPYKKWKLLGYADEKTGKRISTNEVEKRLRKRLRRTSY